MAAGLPQVVPVGGLAGLHEDVAALRPDVDAHGELACRVPDQAAITAVHLVQPAGRSALLEGSRIVDGEADPLRRPVPAVLDVQVDYDHLGPAAVYGQVGGRVGAPPQPNGRRVPGGILEPMTGQWLLLPRRAGKDMVPSVGQGEGSRGEQVAPGGLRRHLGDVILREPAVTQTPLHIGCNHCGNGGHIHRSSIALVLLR